MVQRKFNSDECEICTKKIVHHKNLYKVTSDINLQFKKWAFSFADAPVLLQQTVLSQSSITKNHQKGVTSLSDKVDK